MSSEILTVGNVVAAGSATTRDDAIAEAGRVLVAAGAVTDAYVDAMREREETVSTYMGNYLAIPHGTNEAKNEIKASALSLIRYMNPIDWDGEEVRFVVGIAGVENEHLEILSKIAIVFSEEESVQQLIDAPDAGALYTLLEEVNDQ
ncbi:PTS sugar transporter subunit IIA [Paramicrobacterium fandaimingii]|uniref:PTS sugar transporter subunit IIA n=1 Tax=Paramicrobacterium fandaimingii TaxID=2708079 RepID=UPI0014207BE4|nr:PTS sugar transporter subunit IIA [Microbacterium fandaimingii]